MARDLGTKYVCYKCGTKFYDLKKPVPACPDYINASYGIQKEAGAPDGDLADVRVILQNLEDKASGEEEEAEAEDEDEAEED